MTTHHRDAPLQGKPFLAALQDALRPEVLADASEQMAALVQAVKDQRKKGSLTLRIDLAPDSRVSDIVMVTARVATSPPKPDPIPKLMWTADGGHLALSDPKQHEIPGIRAVDNSDITDDDGGDALEDAR